MADRLLPASDARIVLPELSGLESRGRGDVSRSPRSPRRSTIPDGRAGFSETLARSKTPVAFQKIIAESMMMLRSVTDGTVSAVEFAHAVHGNDLDWCAALGQAIYVTQASAAAAHAAQLEEQKRAVAQAHRIVHEQTQYIDRLVREQEKLRAELSAGEAELARRQDEISFLSMFRTSGEVPKPPPPRVTEADPPAGSAAGDRRAKARPPPSRKIPEHVYRAQLGGMRSWLYRHENPSEREGRVERIEATFAEREAKHLAELERLAEGHKDELRRVHEKLDEERRAQAVAVESREQIAERRRAEEASQVQKAKAEAELYQLHEGKARAQAAAATEVLGETQAALHATRAELNRTSLALQSAHQQVRSLQAAQVKLQQQLADKPPDGAASERGGSYRSQPRRCSYESVGASIRDTPRMRSPRQSYEGGGAMGVAPPNSPDRMVRGAA